MERIPAEESSAPDGVALLQLVLRYKVLIGIVTLACGAAAAAYALTATPMYTAEVGIAEVSAGGMSAAAALASQLGGLASLVGANLGAGGGQAKESDAFLKSRRMIQEFVSRHDMKELFPGRKKLPSLWLAVRQYQQGVISIRDNKRAGTTVVGVTFSDPVVAARWANEFVALVNDLLRTRAMNESRRAIEYLNAQIAKTSDVELQRVMYGLIQNETKTLTLANVRPEYAFTVIDPAVPPEIRVSPQRTIIVMVGLLTGLFVGIACAYWYDQVYLKSRIVR